jgi:hypothetical protein
MPRSIVPETILGVVILGVVIQLAPVRDASAGDCRIYWTTNYSSAKYKVYVLPENSNSSELHADLLAGCSVTRDSSKATFTVYETHEWNNADIRIRKSHVPR